MYKMFIAHVGVLLLALHLFSSQVVQAQTGTGATMNGTMNANMSNTTSPTVNKNGCGNMDAFTLLLPLALGASLLHGWS